MQVLNVMTKVDFPNNWNKLMEQIMQYLSMKDEKGVHTGLLALKALVKKYRLSNEASKQQELFQVFQQSEEYLVQLLQHCMSNDSDLSAHMLYLVAKIFQHANSIVLCPCLKDSQKL